MLALQIYKQLSSVARGKRFGSGKNSCTSHNRSIPSSKRFENCPVRGTSKAKPSVLFRTIERCGRFLFFLRPTCLARARRALLRYPTPKPPPSGRWLCRRKRLRILLMQPAVLVRSGGDIAGCCAAAPVSPRYSQGWTEISLAVKCKWLSLSGLRNSTW